jgi:hypothetical protein
LWWAKHLQQVLLKNTSTSRWFETGDEHQHIKVVWNLWRTPCLQHTSILHIAMKCKSASMIQYTMHKRISTNKDNKFGGRSTPSTDKSFKTNINANSKQHERSFVIFMHIEKNSHPPQWRLAFLMSTNKALATRHTLRERLGENKKPVRDPFGELLQLLCETSWQGKDNFLITQLLGWSRSRLLVRSTIVIVATCQHPKRV